MRFSTVLLSTFFMASSLAISTDQKALQVLDIVKAVREDVHTSIDAIKTSLSQVTADNNAAQNASSVASIRITFSHLVDSIERATQEVVAKPRIETRQTTGTPISEIVGEIQAIAQDIVSDIIGAIKLLLEAFNDSRFIQDLAGLLLNGLLGFLSAIVKVLVKVPGLQDLINEILKLIPI